MGSSTALYRKRLASGMCGGCGFRPYRKNKTSCETCFQRKKKWKYNKTMPQRIARNLRPSKEERRKMSVLKFRQKNREKCLAATKACHLKLKMEIFNYYGFRCKCCGETRIEFITIDHMNNDGAQHRKEIGSKIYAWIKRNNFPSGFQTLCMNCNWAKGKFGECPHERERRGIHEIRA